MPMSKAGKLYYTDEQLQTAKDSSALAYAQQNGYELEVMGNYYKMKKHDSFIFSPNGRWFWNSENISGNAIDFLIKIEHRDFIEAVLILSGDRDVNSAVSHSHEYTNYKKTEAVPKAPFVLPEKAKSFNRLFGYLMKERALDNRVVIDLVNSGRIYLSAPNNNAVFVSLDTDGTPRSAFQRGTLSFAQKPFKKDVAGSDKTFPFVIPCKASTTVNVFEGAIDAASHASICIKQTGEYDDCFRIATGGITNYSALDKFLGWHPEIKLINFCFDNDKEARKNHGQDAAREWADKYSEKGYTVQIMPPQNKDYNDDLKQYMREIAENTVKNIEICGDIGEYEDDEEYEL